MLPSDVFSTSNKSSTLNGWHTTRTGNRPMNSASNPKSIKSRVCACSSASVSLAVLTPGAAKPIVASRNRRNTCFSNPPNAPLTMNKICRVLIVVACFLPRCDASIIA